MGLFGGGSKSKFETITIPGGFDDPSASKAAEFATQISDLTNRNIASPGVDATQPATERPFFDQFTQQIENPQLGARTPNEQSIIAQLVAQANSASANRGTGPATTGTIAQAIAPQLFEFRQRELDNLRGGESTFGGTQLAERGQDIQSTLGTGQLDLNNFNSIIAALSGLTEFASPQTIGGTTTTTEGPGVLDTLINLGSVAASAGAFGAPAGFGTRTISPPNIPF